MERGRPAQQVALTANDKGILEELVRQKTAAHRDVQRAQIALMANQGETSAYIAEVLGLSEQTVCKWRGRAARLGKEGLNELPRSGRPPRITDAERLQLIALACERADDDGGRSTPTLNELVVRAQERGIVSHISKTHYHRILQEADLHPHRVRQWLHSPDPDFRSKVNEICDLYRQPPKASVVLSVDEKTGIQAIERKRPDRPPQPGSLRRWEFEYKRHGTQTLIAALDVHSGKVLLSCGKRRTQADLLAFMGKVAKAYPEGPIHVIWDNLNTHLPEKWEAFNQAQGGRFHFHFTPIHASWVNQVELLFSSYSQACLHNASHTSTAHLREKTLAFFEERNRDPKPFKWRFRGYQLQTGEPKQKPGRKRHDLPSKPVHRNRDPVPAPQGHGA